MSVAKPTARPANTPQYRSERDGERRRNPDQLNDHIQDRAGREVENTMLTAALAELPPRAVVPRKVGPPPIRPNPNNSSQLGRSPAATSGATMPNPSVALCRGKPDHQQQVARAISPRAALPPIARPSAEVVQPDTHRDQQVRAAVRRPIHCRGERLRWQPWRPVLAANVLPRAGAARTTARTPPDSTIRPRARPGTVAPSTEDRKEPRRPVADRASASRWAPRRARALSHKQEVRDSDGDRVEKQPQARGRRTHPAPTADQQDRHPGNEAKHQVVPHPSEFTLPVSHPHVVRTCFPKLGKP